MNFGVWGVIGLGVYLLAKYAGLYADAEGTESCTLPVVPLFETIGDLQGGPALTLSNYDNQVLLLFFFWTG